MALSNTIEFLPPVFRTPTNQRFLGATVDQLFTDPVVIPLNGYVGRRFSPTYKNNDNYIPELTLQRQNYQLEPSVVVKDNNKNIFQKNDISKKLFELLKTIITYIISQYIKAGINIKKKLKIKFLLKVLLQLQQI